MKNNYEERTVLANHVLSADSTDIADILNAIKNNNVNGGKDEVIVQGGTVRKMKSSYKAVQ